MKSGLDTYLRQRLDTLRAEGNHRILVPLRPGPGPFLIHRGRRCLNLSGNDYLGLAADPDLVAGFFQGLDRQDILACHGPGSTGSRLMTGTWPVHDQLEERLARMYGREAALVFGSGYHANLGLLPALAGRDDLILADKLCHASLIDGMRLSRARVIRYPHLDLDRLQSILAAGRDGYRHVFVVSESIFSMDGDIADLGRLVELKERYRAILYLDEAHAVGIRGARGLGCAEEQGVLDRIDFLVGTFGKGWGGQGAFCLLSGVARDFLVNTARSFLFSTALPPVALSWLLMVADLIPELGPRRARLDELAARLRRELGALGLETRGASQIVPVLVGDSDRCVQVAAALREAGFWVTAIRPPTVPRGTARLRLSLTAAMGWDDLASLPGEIARLMRRP